MDPVPACPTIGALLDGYRDGRLTPVTVAAELLRRIDTDSGTEIWISRVPQSVVLNRAAEMEVELDRCRHKALAARPLLGIPFAVKDNIDVAGLPTTAGCPAFAYRPTRSAEVVERLEAAGAIVVGKTNMDQFATGLVGTRSPYGEGKNPFDPAYISGGSSSGSALATACGQTPFALATDTAGSGRVPAAFCNLVGLKPSPGVVSNRGVVPACRSLDCVAVFAHTVADAWRVLETIATRDDAYIDPPLALGLLTREIRLGIPATLRFFGDRCAMQAFNAVLAALDDVSGIALKRVSLNSFDAVASLLYEGPWIAERRAALGAFLKKHRGDVEPTVRQIIERGDRPSAVDAFEGRYRLAELRAECDAIWRRGEQNGRKVDVLLVPTAPTIFTRAEVAADPIGTNSGLGIYTNFVNLLGLAALALPGPFREDGLPAGVTLIGPGGSDHRLAEIGRRLEPLLHRCLGVTWGPPPRRNVALCPLPYREPTVEVAVVGAHLAGLPLNWQLLERSARLTGSTATAPEYRLYRLPDTLPPKPGLTRVCRGGAAIAVEIWEMPLRHFGSFVAEIPPPLSIGTVKLADGRNVKGFLCESAVLKAAIDITAFGGWRAYLEKGVEKGAEKFVGNEKGAGADIRGAGSAQSLRETAAPVAVCADDSEPSLPVEAEPNTGEAV